MEIKLRKASPLQVKTGCLTIGVYEKSFSTPLLKELDQKLGGLLGKARRSGEFSGKDGEQILFQPAGHLPAERVLLIGLGTPKSATLENLRKAAGIATQQAIKTKVSQTAFALALTEVKNSDIKARIGAIAEGTLLASYRYDRFLGETAKGSRKLPSAITLLIDSAKDKQACEKTLSDAQKLGRAVILARDLVNAPGNIK